MSNWQDRYHYQKATGKHRCGNCDAFKNGQCRMFDSPVEPDSVCNQWTNDYKTSGWKEVTTAKTAAGQVMYHFAPAEHRDTILREGLRPNMPDKDLKNPEGIYLWHDPDAYDDELGATPRELYHHTDESGLPLKDMYEVNVAGLPVQPDTWYNEPIASYVPHAIPPERLRRVSNQGQVMYHVAPRERREGIMANGLIPRDNRPGFDDVHLWPALERARQYQSERGNHDLWEVQADPATLINGPIVGALVHRGPIPPDRLRLLNEGTTASTHDITSYVKLGMAWDFKTCPVCHQPLDPANPGQCENVAAHPYGEVVGPGPEMSDLGSVQPVMYHGTRREYRDSIMHEGLHPHDPGHSPDQPASVHFGTTPEEAREWAGPDGDVWEVNVQGHPGFNDQHSYNVNGEDENYLTRHHVGPERLRLLSHDKTSGWEVVSDTPSSSPQIAQWIQNGGFTVDSYKLQEVPQLPEYLVALPNAETKMRPESLSMTQVRNKAYEAQQYGAPFVGGWLDKMTDILYLDIVDGFRDLEEALTKAKEWGQKAIYDTIKGEEIRVDSDTPKTPGEAPMDYQPSSVPAGLTAPPKEAARAREPSYVQRWIDHVHPNEFHGHVSDCINPKCQHHWTHEEENELLNYGEIRCPNCMLMQTIDGNIGGFNDAQNNYGNRPGGQTRSGLSLTDMGQMGQEIVKRAHIPGFTFHHEFTEPNWPVDQLWKDDNGQLHGMEIKTNHSLAQPRFKLGDAAERQKKIQYAAENGLRQGLIGVRLNFHTNQADVFHRPQFTDTWVGAPAMTHVGTYDFSDLNPFKSPGEVPTNLPEEKDDIPF